MLCAYIIFTKCDSVPIRNQQSLSSQEQKESEEEKTPPMHTQSLELVMAQGIEKIILCLN